MISINLQVDSNDVPIKTTQRLLQRDPFPGGHDYRLTLKGGKVLSRFTGLESGDQLSVRDQARIFFVVEGLVASYPGESEVPAQILLNSVARLYRAQTSVILEGVCSVVGSPPVV